VLGLRTRDQNVPRHSEFAAVKLLNPRDLLRRLALEALMQIATIVNPPDLAKFFVGMGDEPDAIVTYGVRQKHLGGESRNGNTRGFEELLTLE
jgi:hypothetical protein